MLPTLAENATDPTLYAVWAATVAGALGAMSAIGAFVGRRLRRNKVVELSAATELRNYAAEVREEASHTGSLLLEQYRRKVEADAKGVTAGDRRSSALESLIAEHLMEKGAVGRNEAREKNTYFRYHDSAIRQNYIFALAALIAAVLGFATVITAVVLSITVGVAVGVITGVTGVLIEAAAKLFDTKASEARREAHAMFLKIEELAVRPKQLQRAMAIARIMRDGPERENLLAKLAMEAVAKHEQA